MKRSINALLQCALASLSVSSAWATDSYNPANNQLTIPSVSAAGTTYYNVVITVGTILGATQGGTPKGTVDSYDAALNQLSIPSVTVNGVTYTNALITVGKILSVGGIMASFPGLIYQRDAATAYKANTSGEGIAAASISSGSGAFAALSDSSGRFALSMPATVKASDTLTINVPGYIPIGIDRSIVDTKTPFNSFGLYPTQTVLKKPGFLLGVYTMDSGGELINMFTEGKFAPTYDRIVEKTSANLVGISDPAWVTAWDDTAATVTMSRNASIPMLTKDQYRYLTDLAKQRNLKFLMQIGLYPDAGVTLPYSVSATNNLFWNAWFAAYKTIVLEQVQIANELGIEYISLGMNNSFMTYQQASRWSDLVNSVRAAGYKGKLLYQGMTDLASGGDESTGYDPSFVKLFDYLAIDIYTLAPATGGSPVVSRSEMKKNVSSLLAKYAAYPVPLLIMVGTPSVESGATSSEYIEPCLPCGAAATRNTLDLFTQADAYQAIFEAINDGKTGNGNVVGLLSWGYWYSNNYRLQLNSVTGELNGDDALNDSAGTGRADDYAYDKSASVRGKPAESLLKWWMDNIK
ncbi:MAG TPA: hypothetical protein VMH83_08400 [Candidatus Acidoferrum sp.]|nr:hypothetical protein [Candidatus Acidoferrum sp.]